MKNIFQSIGSAISILLLLFLISGCSSVRGYTAQDKRQYALDMRENATMDLYDLRPGAKIQVEKAAGYAVFSNINTHLIFLGAVHGYGIVRDHETKDDIYMKMLGLGGGFGMGIKDFRAVIIFKKRADLLRFIEKGWDFSGQVDAVAQSGEKGLSLSGAQSIDLDIITYQLTESGIALQAILQGTKVWKHKELN